MHKHQCPDCGCVWEHDEIFMCIQSAHKCPRCGTEQVRKYFGTDPSEFFHTCTLSDTRPVVMLSLETHPIKKPAP